MPYLRSLDALHLATALYMKPVITEFITDDNHLARAAEFSGFLVTAPA
jgi:predicted nucleic acid-binding protein